jgi:hypothetical protein
MYGGVGRGCVCAEVERGIYGVRCGTGSHILSLLAYLTLKLENERLKAKKGSSLRGSCVVVLGRLRIHRFARPEQKSCLSLQSILRTV